MKIETHNINNAKIAEIIANGVVLSSTEDALELLGNLYYQGYDKIIIHEKNIAPGFFDLKSKIAGDILQKFAQYQMPLTIVGDFTKYKSKSLNQFIFETNKGKQINFVLSSPVDEKSTKKNAATFFKTQEDFRDWLERNHKTVKELLVGFYKVDSGKPSMTWPQSVDQALCFGWIDGIRKSIDSESYCIRFSPRKSTSNWSTINIRKVEELTKAGLMKPAGLEVFALRKEEYSGIYSHENDEQKLDSDLEIKFKNNKIAWDFFMKQPPSYRKAIVRWIMSAKQYSTRQSRIEKAINEFGQQKRLT